MGDNDYTAGTAEQIFEVYDQGYPRFEWFISFYFGKSTIDILKAARFDKDIELLLSTLNKVWFELPDSQFNIKENPAGWTEFLNVIED